MRMWVRDARARVAILVSRSAGLLLFGLILLTIAAPRFTAIPYSRWSAMAALGILGVLAALLIRRGPRVPDRLARVLALLTGVACTVVAAFVAYASYYVTTWDSKLVQNLVSRPLGSLSAYEVAYVSRYPNNEALVALARQARWMGEALGVGYGTAFLALQVLFFAVALLGVYQLTTLMASRAAAIVAMVLVTLFVGVSPWMAVPYTDLPSMWTPVWAIYFFALARRSKSPLVGAAWVAVGGGVLALGYSLKVTPVVVVFAAVIWFVGKAVVERSRRSWITCGVQLASLTTGLVIGLVAAGPVVARMADLPAPTPGVAASPWHYVAGGLRVQTGPDGNRIYGGYDRPVNVATFGKPTEVQTRISQEFISRELERRGTIGTLLFEVNKLDFNWGDGMLWAYGEGTDLARQPVHRRQPFEFVQSWNSPSGQFFGVRIDLAQSLWWLMLALVASGWVRGRVTAESMLLLGSLVGIAGFTLLFEGRSRYLLTYVPLLAVAAVWWWDDFRGSWPRRPEPEVVESLPK